MTISLRRSTAPARPTRARVAVGCVLLLCLSCAAAAAQAKATEPMPAPEISPVEPVLLSPWDLHPVQAHAGGYACVPPPPLPTDIAAYDFYSDAKKSVIDPTRYAAYQAVQSQFRQATDSIEAAADRYQATGSQAAAECVERSLLAQAKAAALTGTMASNQSYYVQNWTLGALAICWLKVRGAQPGTADERAAIEQWLRRVGQSTEAYFQARHDKGTVDSQNNHLYWAGLAVMAAGIAANDHTMFQWARGTYDAGVERILPDGTLPLEMARGQRALHYHLFALAPLVTMAELGAANGLDLYGEDHAALSRLVARAVAGLLDNTYFTAHAGAQQDTPEHGRIKSDDILALTPYVRRYPTAAPSAALNQLLHTVPLRPYGYLGGMPPR